MHQRMAAFVSVSSGTNEWPWKVGEGSRPASSKTVGAMSITLTRLGQLLPGFTVAENIKLNRERLRGRRVAKILGKS